MQPIRLVYFFITSFYTSVLCAIAFTRPAVALTNHIVISEVQISGAATTDDFIELYNPTAQDINLDNYRLVKRAKEGTSDTTIKSFGSGDVIPAYGYYLWANSSYLAIGVVPDGATAQTIAADNGIALREGAEDTGTIIDAVGWGEAANGFVEGGVFAINPEAGQSLERLPGAPDAAHGNGDDSDHNATDFTLRAISEPQNTTIREYPAGVTPPVQQDPVTYSEKIWINEILPSPGTATDWDSDGVGNSHDEWIELYNADTVDIDLGGWTLDDIADGGSSPYSFPAGAMIASGGYLVVYKKDSGLVLNNTGDSVIFKTPTGILRDQVDFGSTASDVAYARSESGAGSWVTTATPTPGSLNTLPVATTGGGGSASSATGNTTASSATAPSTTASTTTNSSNTSNSQATQGAQAPASTSTQKAPAATPKATFTPVVPVVQKTSLPVSTAVVSRPERIVSSVANTRVVGASPAAAVATLGDATVSYRPTIYTSFGAISVAPSSVETKQVTAASEVSIPVAASAPIATRPGIVIPFMLASVLAIAQYVVGLPIVATVGSWSASLFGSIQTIPQQHREIIEQLFQKK